MTAPATPFCCTACAAVTSLVERVMRDAATQPHAGPYTQGQVGLARKVEAVLAYANGDTDERIWLRRYVPGNQANAFGEAPLTQTVGGAA